MRVALKLVCVVVAIVLLAMPAAAQQYAPVGVTSGSHSERRTHAVPSDSSNRVAGATRGALMVAGAVIGAYGGS